MTEITHTYSLKGEWQAQVAEKLNMPLIRNKVIVLPSHFAKGITYYLPVMPGISIVLLDAIFSKEVNIKRLVSDDDLYILVFDLSEETNTFIVNESSKKVNSKSGFSVLHTSIKSSFKPIINQRTFIFSLLVNRETLLNYLYQNNNQIKDVEKKILFYDHINSNSKILINSIKEKHVFDIQFDSYIRGISLKAFANFIETYTNPTKDILITDINREQINNSVNYLLNHLNEDFPKIQFLAKMAKMSDTRYKILFKKIKNKTPNQFFIEKKMLLARKLLKSGSFNSIQEISHSLNFNTTHFFSTKYISFFKKRPSDDFIKKY